MQNYYIDSYWIFTLTHFFPLFQHVLSEILRSLPIVLSEHYRLWGGLRGAPEVPPLCRETQSLGQQMLNAPVGINGLIITWYTDTLSCVDIQIFLLLLLSWFFICIHRARFAFSFELNWIRSQCKWNNLKYKLNSKFKGNTITVLWEHPELRVLNCCNYLLQ